MKYHTGLLTGLLDLRDVEGPFKKLDQAKRRAADRSIDYDETGFPADDNNSFFGAWFSIHPKGGMVDGPYGTQRIAESERQKNISNHDSFICDCGEDKGFIAKLVAMYGNVGVFEQC